MLSPTATLPPLDGSQHPLREAGTGQTSFFFQAVFNSLMQGVLILNQRRELIQANTRARELCKLLEQQCNQTQCNQTQCNQTQCNQTRHSHGPTAQVPAAVMSLCQTLLSSRKALPGLLITPELELKLGDSSHLKAHLKLRARWLELSDQKEPYILVTLEEQREMLRHQANWDAYCYGLTAREAEVWSLRSQGYSYAEIAVELYISVNTVKKHLKSIASKRSMEMKPSIGEPPMGR